MLDPVPLSALDANGKVSDDARPGSTSLRKPTLSSPAATFRPASYHLVFDEAKRRGVKKMLVNHPTYVVGCNDEDIRQMVAAGVFMEHSICMFADGKAHKFSSDDLAHLINVAGVDHTVLSSDLGLLGNPRARGGLSPDRPNAAGSAILDSRTSVNSSALLLPVFWIWICSHQ